MTSTIKTKESNSPIVINIPTARLFPNPSQPRFIFDDEPLLRLADSIKRHGILQPLSVRPSSNGTYQIIAGERRWRAARIADIEYVPCLILEVDSQKSAELALIENIQREDLNIFEQAAAIASLIDIYGLTQEQAARQLSSSQSHIANKLRILKLSPAERTEIIKHGLTERHARAILRLPDSETRLEVIRHIRENDLNVSATDNYVDKVLANTQKKTRRIKGKLKDLRIFSNTLDKATNLLKDCGYNVQVKETTVEHTTQFIITIESPSFT